MTFKRAMYASTLAAGVGLAGLFGVGLGTASADPGQCNATGRPPCGQDQHDNGRGQRQRRARNNNGAARRLAPPRRRPGPSGPPAVQLEWPAGQPRSGRQRAGWGFWFGPVWIPL